MTTVTVPNPETPLTYGTCKVYVRQTWVDPAGGDNPGDPTPWVEVVGLQALEVVWSVAPSMPTAMLSWDYGRVKGNASQEWVIRPKLTIERWFVKIVADMQPNTDPGHEGEWHQRTWVGVAMFADDRQGGNYQDADDNQVAKGTQLWTCHGMEQLLAEHEIRTAVWRDGTTYYRIGRSLDFNARRRDRTLGNRTATADGDGFYQFAKDPANAATWSTAEHRRVPAEIPHARGRGLPSHGAVCLDDFAADVGPTRPHNRRQNDLQHSLAAHRPPPAAGLVAGIR
jgi:hypothetical protein